MSGIKAVGLRELTSRLPQSLFVQDSLHRVEDVAAIFRGSHAGQCSILVYCGDNLRHLGFYRLFGVLDLFDPLITLVCQTCQIALKALHAVVRGAIRTLFDPILFCHPPRLALTLAEGVAEVISCVALLFCERTGLRHSQHICEMSVPSFDLSPIHLPMRKGH